MPKIKKRGSAAKDRQEQDIVNVAHKVSAVLSRYKKQFTIAVSALIAVLVILAGYSLFQAQRNRQAAPLVAAAYEYYNDSEITKADYAKALDLFRDIQKKYSGTKNGAVAQYYVGNCLSNLEQIDEALKEYRIFIGKYSEEKLLLGLVYQRMGYIYSMLGNQAEAIKAFEQAEKADGPGVATYELARLYEASGNIPESQTKYKQVLDKLSGTSWGVEAMGKVQKIAAESQPAAGKAGK